MSQVIIVSTTETVVRTVPVNRSRTGKQALNAATRSRSRRQSINSIVVDGMPKGHGNETEIVFFKPDLSERDGHISNDDLEKEYELRGLEPADPFSVASVNEVEQTFADQIPHGTHWKDADGNWCCLIFRQGVRGLVVYVDQSRGWSAYWWFAGIRKKTSDQVTITT